MTDRMDIDALLIGALYGELTLADEARLTAHLESHPADRAALADLSRTREAVRESRILAVQLDPPQSVSALLLQEAARRAPRPQRESWFHRIAHSFMAHPALAAAATCVVVVSVAGALYVRHGAKLAEDSTRPDVDHSVAAGPTSLAQQGPEPPAVAAPASPSAAPTTPPSAVTPAPEPTAIAAGESADKAVVSKPDARGYGVRLDELAKEGAARPVGRIAGRAKDSPSDDENDDDHGAVVVPEKTKKSQNSDPDPKSDPKSEKSDRFAAGVETKAAPSKKAAKGIVLRSPEPQPMELAKNENRVQRDLTGARGGAAAAKPATPSTDDSTQAPAAGAAPPPPAAPPPSQTLELADRVGNNASQAPAKPVTGPKAPNAAPSPGTGNATGNANTQRNDRRLADQGAAPADAKLAEEKERANDSVLGWAQKQREQVIAHVRSNDCRAAANAAVEIYNRAPDYYASNVATDRSIKPCLPYLRQREDRARAAKRSNAADAAPPQASQPPPRAKPSLPAQTNQAPPPSNQAPVKK